MSCSNPRSLPPRSILRGESYRPIRATLRDSVTGDPLDLDGAELVLEMRLAEGGDAAARWSTDPGESELELIWDAVEGLLESEWVRSIDWPAGEYRGHLWALWAATPPGQRPLLEVRVTVGDSWTDVTGGD